jgi:hypothetical protein
VRLRPAGRSQRWQRLADEGVDVRSAAGQLFSRSKDGGKSDAYKSLSTKEKAEFRRAWAEGIWQDMKIKRESSRSWQRVDASKGFYAPFAIIVREEGNDNAALRAAGFYVGACEKMGGVWKRFNTMTQRTEWLYMRKHVKEEFIQAWSLYETAVRKSKDADSNGTAAGSAEKGTGKGGRAKKTGEGGEEVDPKADPKADPKPGKPKPGRSSLEVAFTAANASKKR